MKVKISSYYLLSSTIEYNAIIADNSIYNIIPNKKKSSFFSIKKIIIFKNYGLIIQNETEIGYNVIINGLMEELLLLFILKQTKSFNNDYNLTFKLFIFMCFFFFNDTVYRDVSGYDLIQHITRSINITL